MSKIDNYINNFFERIKRKQAEKVIKNFTKENPKLAKKLDKINDAYSELEDYLKKNGVE
ncbi:MAG: hypothetical protein K9N07_09735 [Candidatus Cloacimonetes bacterium]|nr:hypothetical protein [Candidatus Cloacimonadota bacterium]